jgi:hypothetical protein
MLKIACCRKRKKALNKVNIVIKKYQKVLIWGKIYKRSQCNLY